MGFLFFFSSAAATAAIAADEKKDKKEKGALAKKAAKFAKAEAKADKAYAKKKALEKKALDAKRSKEAGEKAAVAAKADAVYAKEAKKAALMKENADKAAAKEKAFKKKAAEKLASEEKASKQPAYEFPQCKGGQCLKDNKCHDTTATGPFMCADLVSCCDKAPAVAPYSGMSWAHIPPPPAPVPPKPSKKCLAEKAKCKADAKCAPLMAGDWVKSTKKAGCQKSKGLLDLWFAVTSECPYAKYPGFESNIPMWKEQIEDMPEYVDSGTTGRFKAKKGAGSICTMVKELVNGFAAGFPDSATAPEASSVGGMKWEAPKGGWDFKDE